MWAILAAAALATRVLLVERLPGTQPFAILSLIGFGLLLPPIAILHARLAPSSAHGAILATLAGTATAITGLAATLLNDLEPAALFFLGMWWWVLGKLLVQERASPRAFGIATAVGAVAVFGATLGNVVGAGRWTWHGPLLALAAWLLALAWLAYREVRRDKA